MVPWYKQRTTWAGVIGVLASAASLYPGWKAMVVAALSGVSGVLIGTNTTTPKVSVKTSSGDF